MAHRYWRLYVLDNFDPSGGSGSNHAFTSLVELEMFSTSGGANQCTGGTAIASSDYTASPWGKATAFNGVKTGDSGWAANNQLPPVWIGYDFGAGNEKDIVEYAITSRTDPGSLAQTPRIFALQFSDNGTDWTFTKSYEVQYSSWTGNETRTFSIEPSEFELLQGFNTLEHSLNVSGNNQNVNFAIRGLGEISGVISIEGSPANNVLVRLHHADTGTFLQETTTNILGAYQFTNLRSDLLYDVVAEDPLQEWEKRVSSRREPYIA